MTTTLIIIFVVFLLTHLIDAKIRKWVYNVDVNLAKLNVKKEFDAKTHGFENHMNQGWQQMVSMNNYRYGIVGNFDYDLNKNDKYEIVGDRTGVGTGIVLTREHVTRDQIVDDMAQFYQNNKKPFVAAPDELRDRYIITMYAQENMVKFIWDDKGLYNNVDVGDKVSISFNDKGILSIGYRVKGVKNEPDTQRKVDMGRD